MDDVVCGNTLAPRLTHLVVLLLPSGNRIKVKSFDIIASLLPLSVLGSSPADDARLEGDRSRPTDDGRAYWYDLRVVAVGSSYQVRLVPVKRCRRAPCGC